VNGDAGLPPVAPAAVAIAADPLELTIARLPTAGLASGLGAGA
jgi:hypothetical protein